jgi:hypothetical protein
MEEEILMREEVLELRGFDITMAFHGGGVGDGRTRIDGGTRGVDPNGCPRFYSYKDHGVADLAA